MDILSARTDVLIIGGGMAATWAAIAAAREGADVILVDKGYVGTSGVTATGGPNHWWVPPDPSLRREAVERRLASSQGLGDAEWMARIIDITWRTLPELAPYYPFAKEGTGKTYYSGVRGPEYMRALRAFALDSGVRILDHHPATELLVHPDGGVAGARGQSRLDGKSWEIHSGAVILATGGCAFRSGLIGSHGNTGDGYLFAAEAGAELSGMEFSVSYSLSPAWSSTRTLPYLAARFLDKDGTELDIPPPLSGHGHQQALGAAMLAGPVYADLSDAPALLKNILRRIQPASPLPFERRGIDIFSDRFEVKLFGEGTIRGVGGLRIVDEDCQTSVRGLYAAGDAATRELVTGAISGGGSVNAAWALSSGQIAGKGAAQRALRDRASARDTARPVGTVGLRPEATPRPIDAAAITARVQSHMHGYDKALWRRQATLSSSQHDLDALWQELARHAYGTGNEAVTIRELAAMVATARWCTSAALARKESRGIHVRIDAPNTETEWGVRLLTGGLDKVWTRPETRTLAEATA